MKKIEIIWRELLFQAMEKQNRRFTQKELAEKFNFSTSTVFQALKMPRKMGAVRVTGRFFILQDPEKLLYHWASVRNFEKEVIFSGRINLPVLTIEGNMPPEVVFGAFSAAREILREPPADYDKVFAYAQVQSSTPEGGQAKLKVQSFLKELKSRFELEEKSLHSNLIILKADSFLGNYGSITTFGQTFVDLWNLSDWYAKEFIRALKEKINELLS